MERIKNWIGRFWVQHLIACWGLFGVASLWFVVSGQTHLLYAASVLFVASLAVVALRAIIFPEDFQNDWMRICGTLGYLGCACAGYYFAGVVEGSHHTAGLVIWGVAFALNLLCIGRFTVLLLKDGFYWDKVVPACALVYCTPGVAAITGEDLGLTLLGKVLTVYVVFASVVTLYGIIRYVRFQDLPDKYVPGETALVAAPSVAAVAWMMNFGVHGTLIAVVLVLIGQVLLVKMLLELPTFLNLAVGPSFAHFIFPFAISAQALYDLNTYVLGGNVLVGVLLKFEIFMALFIGLEILMALTVENIRRMQPAKQKKLPKFNMPMQKAAVAGAFCDLNLYNKILDSNLSDICDVQLADVIKLSEGVR